ncbi:MAG: amidohydrolase family protein [Hyphomicrobiales bacterium]|nr:amidohydrolase family protein [Hyphomicrobiales bacterium]
MLEGQNASILIRGNVVLPDGIAKNRYIHVDKGVIASISRRKPPLTDTLPYFELGSNDWIFPGLLDLHTHSNYNLLPIWRSYQAPFDNRFEWRGYDEYRKEVRGVHKQISTPENKKAIAVFGELQAVAGGTSVLQESFDLDSDIGAKDRLLLCRDTASARDLGLPKSKKIFSVVDFYRPDRTTGEASTVDSKFNRYLKEREKGNLAATLAHLAEGRSGFGSGRGVDPYSRSEFEAFMQHPAMADAGLVRQSSMALIHGCGINPRDPGHIQFLRERNISIIWSPVSNLMLYGDTIDVETLLDAGINVALGSDWSPSGSKHVWDEAKFARCYFDAIGSSVPDEQIFQMVTTNAAHCLGLSSLGRIAVGAHADFFILRSPLETDYPQEVFLSTEDRHVLATVIAGRPIYGDKEFLSRFTSDTQPLPRVEGSAVKNKAVHLPPSVEVDMNKDLHRIEATMKALKPPVKRSNLLVSSDKIYKRDMQLMRSRLYRFGWSVREWRHDGAKEGQGEVKVKPSAARVWRGFKSKGIKWDKFVQQLADVFVPSAVGLQAPLGLTAYLPALLHEDRPAGVPDEIALVFFESQRTYGDIFKSVAGRAFGMLHAPVFESATSRSGFPAPFGGDLATGKPVYLVDTTADWQNGHTRVIVGAKKNGQSQDGFLAELESATRAALETPPAGLQGAILAPESDCFVYWENWLSKDEANDWLGSSLLSICEPQLDTYARREKVPSHLYWKFSAADFKPGDCLNVVFERRALFPW